MRCLSHCRVRNECRGPLDMSRAPVGGHTDADTRGHTPHEKTPRWRVGPPDCCAQCVTPLSSGDVK